MNTPICDFVAKYAKSGKQRMHMPGHKGARFIGVEELDVTEITGADSLYHANGIIRESEENAGKLFGAHTFYSTEGSSLCIRAMLYLAKAYAREKGVKCRILAGRNCHKSFISAVALLDIDVDWLYKNQNGSYLSCPIDGKGLDEALSKLDTPPVAVYLTSPDYLGNLLKIDEISSVCKKYGTLLLVDNAHGAYTRFLSPSEHPISLGADLCADSAHKTLPALTGSAYLHVRFDSPGRLIKCAKEALSLFGSTSPSYLILQSLDKLNAYISDGYSAKLKDFIAEINKVKERLTEVGYTFFGNEKLKITIKTKPYGYDGVELMRIMERKGIVCEFSDPDHVVLMPTVETKASGLQRLEEVLRSIPKRKSIKESALEFKMPERIISVREALFSETETVEISDAIDKVFCDFNVGCPPAVSVLVPGERITEDSALALKYYGFNRVRVVKDKK